MVALDADGRPASIPPLHADSPAAVRRMREAELRRANRLAEREQILHAREAEAES
jgi:acyl-CoA hydrolase